MKRKLLSTLTALCMAFTLLPTVTPAVEAGESDPALYVGDTLVSGTLAPEVTYWDDASGTGGEAYVLTESTTDYLFAVSYDEGEEAFTLILNGVNVTTQFDGCGIFCNTALDIVLADASDNIVSVSHNNPYSCAVRSWGELTVNGSGKLELSAEGSNAEGSFSVGIEATENICISDGEIIIETDTNADESCGLYSDKDITVTGGSLKVNAARYGLYAPVSPYYNNGVGGAITISGGIVNIDAGIYGIVSDWGDVTVSGGTAIVDISNDPTHAGGTAALFTQSGSITVSGGTVIANAKGTGNYGIQTQDVDNVGASASIDGGAVYAYGSSYAIAVGQNDAVTHPSDGVRQANGKYVIMMTEKDGTSYNPTILYNANVPLEIGPDEPESPGVYVGDFPFAYDYSKWATAPDTLYGDFSAESSRDYTWSVKYNTAETDDDASDDTLDLTLNGLVVTDTESSGIDAAVALNLTLSGENSIDADRTGIYCMGNLRIQGDGSLDIFAGKDGICATGDLRAEDGQLTVRATENGLSSEDGDILLSGGETELDVICGSPFTRVRADYYGLWAENGAIDIADARINVEKFGNRGGGIQAKNDIGISGNAQVQVVDWSSSPPLGGIYSKESNIAIGGNASVDIVSQQKGIYASRNVYIGCVWDESQGSYISSGDPTVKINDGASVTDVTPDTPNDFTPGQDGIYTDEEDIYISGGNVAVYAGGSAILSIGEVNISGGVITAASEDYGIGIVGNGGIVLSGGSLTASGPSKALYPNAGTVTVTMPTYKHRTNTSPSVPTTPYSFFPGTEFDADNAADYKYVNIMPTFLITSVDADNGSFAVTVDGAPASSAAAGDTVTLSAAARAGYTFSSWSICKTSDSTMAVPLDGDADRFIMPAYPVTVEASFTQRPSSGGGGSAPAVRTITVTETSGDLFSNSRGAISAQANMTDAFSNSVEVKVRDTEENSAAFGFSTGTQVYPFDISLYIKGTNTKTEPKPGYTVTIALPVPEDLLDVKDALIIVHKADNGTVSTLSSHLEQKDRVWYLVFAAADFSPYALVVDDATGESASAGVLYYLVDGNKVFIGFAANGAYIAPAGVAVSLTPNPKHFADISGHWAADSIRFVTEREVFLGTRADIFSPNDGMNRAMFATVIGRLYERSFGDITLSASHDFSDCNYNDYYGKYIDWTAQNAIITGYGGGTFAPNDAVTREQMAAILYRFAAYLDKLPESNADALHYADSAAVSSWAKDAALYCQTAAIISGRDGGTFAPQATATRAEVATIIERFTETIVKQ